MAQRKPEKPERPDSHPGPGGMIRDRLGFNSISSCAHRSGHHPSRETASLCWSNHGLGVLEMAAGSFPCSRTRRMSNLETKGLELCPSSTSWRRHYYHSPSLPSLPTTLQLLRTTLDGATVHHESAILLPDGDEMD